MKIQTAEFIKSVAALDQIPRSRLPQVAIAGRSNVGKSSLINYILNRKKLAMVSATPGKTALLNFFLINEQLYLVDFPGYGYARRALTERQRWGDLIESYLESCKTLRAIFLLIDLRRGFNEQDKDFIAWLQLHKHAVFVCYTKCDKLAYGERVRKVAEFNEELGSQGVPPGIAFSVVQGYGKNEFWGAVSGLLQRDGQGNP